jgi:HlyD family secretion protein
MKEINKLRWGDRFLSLSLFMFILILTLSGCSRENKSQEEQIITIKENNTSHALFYSGAIQPLKILVIPSPADGVVIEMPFQYGQSVKKGQLLFKISSAKFLNDYKQALTQYVKAKSELNNNQIQLNEAKFLHKNQLISDDDFKMKQSGYYAARLALLQAKDTLENLLQQLDIKNINLYDLTIAEIDKISDALHFHAQSENLRLLAPANGIILGPNKSTDESKKTMKGDPVKQGDVLAVIGDMSGISVRIKVSELVVNQLKIGQPIKITGIAFPDFVLNGHIRRVDRQGENGNNGLPTFNVEVNVLKLSEGQQKYIHAGMSAKVEISVPEESSIRVPIAAVSEKNGQGFIKLWDEKTRKGREVAVQTGKTSLDSIAILAGLKIGDKIVVPNRT